MKFVGVVTELCAMRTDGSFVYYHHKEGDSVHSMILEHDKQTGQYVFESYHPQQPMLIRDAPFTTTLVTPTCAKPRHCVKITDYYKIIWGLMKADIRKFRTSITVDDEILEKAELKSKACMAVHEAMSIRNRVFSTLSHFACSASTAEEAMYFSPSVPGVLHYTIDSRGKMLLNLTDKLIVTDDDLKEMNTFQLSHSRVIGFIKTSRGMAIDWGIPCQNGESEIAVLEMLERLFNVNDYYFCAAVC